MNNRVEVMEYLMYADTSPVNMSIGVVLNGVVNHNYLVIHKAPPRIVSDLVRRFADISLTQEGLLVPITPLEG